MYIQSFYHVYTKRGHNQTIAQMNQYSGTRKKSPRSLHTEDGKFSPDYGNETKKLRSIRLTDTAWELLAEIADKNHITRTEVIELFARGENLY